MRVVVCDPGVGNVRSVVRSIARATEAHPEPCEIVVTKDHAVVRSADVVVVPGQGAFGPFARGIEGGLGDALREHIAAGRPYLGICLGMQVLFESSEEAPGAAGLGVLRGHVKRLAPGIDAATGHPYALPHIGWNEVLSPAGVAGEPARHFYFAHTYAAEPSDTAVVSGITEYGEARFASTITHGRVMGVQFHPEKSQREGLALMTRFFGI